jgi:glutathione S-transferase
VAAKLYTLSLSHPGHAARLMLERKRIDHEVVELLPGMHPARLRLAGFRGGTVPAVKIDGRRIQGSTVISRALDDIAPDPPLFPADPERRRRVIEAERWCEAEFQSSPRRVFRWATVNRPEFRRWIVADVVGMPLPGLVAATNGPVARFFQRKSSAYDEQVRDEIAALRGRLDRVDALIAEGTIGGAEPNAADFQIGTTVRVVLALMTSGARSRGGRRVSWRCGSSPTIPARSRRSCLANGSSRCAAETGYWTVTWRAGE